eukprot:g15824.t1
MTSPIIGVSQYGGSPSLLNAPPLVGASHKNSPDYHKRGNSYCAYENYPSPSSASRGARAPASPVGRKWSYDKLMAIFEKFDRPERTGVLETENDQTDALEAGCRYLLQRLLVTSIAPRGGSSSSPEERREQEAEAGEAILRATEQFQRILRQSPVLQDILLRRRYGGGLPLALFFELMQIVACNLELAVEEEKRKQSGLSSMRMSRTACGVVLQRNPRPHQRSASATQQGGSGSQYGTLSPQHINNRVNVRKSGASSNTRSYYEDSYHTGRHFARHQLEEAEKSKLTAANVSRRDMEQGLLNSPLPLATAEDVRKQFASEIASAAGGAGIRAADGQHSAALRMSRSSTKNALLFAAQLGPGRHYTKPAKYKNIKSVVKECWASGRPMENINARLSGNKWLEGVHFPAGDDQASSRAALLDHGGYQGSGTTPQELITTTIITRTQTRIIRSSSTITTTTTRRRRSCSSLRVDMLRQLPPRGTSSKSNMNIAPQQWQAHLPAGTPHQGAPQMFYSSTQLTHGIWQADEQRVVGVGPGRGSCAATTSGDQGARGASGAADAALPHVQETETVKVNLRGLNPTSRLYENTMSYVAANCLSLTGGGERGQEKGIAKALKETTPNVKGTPTLYFPEPRESGSTSAGAAPAGHQAPSQLAGGGEDAYPLVPGVPLIQLPHGGTGGEQQPSCKLRNLNTDTLLSSVCEKLGHWISESQRGSPTADEGANLYLRRPLHSTSDGGAEVVAQVVDPDVSAAFRNPETRQLEARLRLLTAD